jgi:hypothetical protein
LEYKEEGRETNSCANTIERKRWKRKYRRKYDTMEEKLQRNEGRQPVTVGSLEKCTFSMLLAGGDPCENAVILTELSEQKLRSSGAKVTDRRSTDGWGEGGCTCKTASGERGCEGHLELAESTETG